MAWGRELPGNFGAVLEMARGLLSGNAELLKRGWVDPEAELIVMAAFWRRTRRGLSRMELYSRFKDAFPADAAEDVLIMATSRAQGKVLQHLTGTQFFSTHEYEVSECVLVPRPETEVLLAHALEALRKPGGEPRLGLEIGLGSGILSIELLSQIERLQMRASELSAAAREVAGRNAHTILGAGFASRLEVLPAGEGQVIEPFLRGEAADFLISNPPYLKSPSELDSLAQDPVEALFAPSGQPLYFYEKIAADARRILKSAAPVFLEIPHERSREIATLFMAQGWDVEVHADLTGKDRVLVAHLRALGR